MMRTRMIHHIKLRKEDRARILRENPGLCARVARDLGVHPTTVQRTFHDQVIYPNQKIVAALKVALKEIGVSQNAAA